MRKILLTLAIAGFALQVSAQDNHDKVLKLFRVMELDKTTSLMTDNIMQMMSKQMPPFKNDSVKRDFLAFMQTEMKSMTTNVINDMLPLYEKTFTSAEIGKYIRFYSSTKGKKLLESQPELTKQLMTTMMTNEMPAFQQRVMKKLTDLEAKYK